MGVRLCSSYISYTFLGHISTIKSVKRTMNDQLRLHCSLATDQENFAAVLECAKRISLEFLGSIGSRPVCGRVQHFADEDKILPKEGVGAVNVLEEFWNKYGACFSASAGPRYYGFVTGGGTPAAVSADWLVSVLDQNAHLTNDSIASVFEVAAVDMLRQSLKLPANLTGLFVSGATMANFVSLGVARQCLGRKMGVDVGEEGVAAMGPMRVISGAAHSSILKTLSMLGIGRKSYVAAPTVEESEVIDIPSLERILSSAPTVPTIVVANAGTVNTASFDDISALANLRKRFGFWLHVDAAFGGMAGLSLTHSRLLKGWEHADSITVDAHKWLNVPYDSAVQFVASEHLGLQIEVFKNVSSYLAPPEVKPDNFLHLGPENSRRFRALPVWLSLKAYGRDGLSNIVDRNISLAKLLGAKIDRSSGFKLLSPVHLNVVCFALSSPEVETRDRFLKSLDEAGAVRCTPTQYNGLPGIRAALVNWMTEEKDIDIAFSSMLECRDRV